MLDAAVEIGISAFLFTPDLDDGDLEAALTERGVAPWLAARLMFFLPLAFGRLFLGECNLRDTYQSGDQERPLAEDPVWVACAARADRATRDEVSAIGTRSSEVAAVNQYLETHPEGEDKLGSLSFSSPTLVTPLPPLPSGEPSAEPSDGGVPSPALAFRQFLESHGHAVTDEVDDPSGTMRTGDLRFTARVYPRQAKWAQVQVDFFVEHPALHAPYLLESFAGFGETWGDALRQTITKFERNSLHVFIAALLDRASCKDQVEWEPLGDAAARFDLCFGGALQTFGSGPAPLLGPLIDELKAALATRELGDKAHGLRVFLAFDGGELGVCEVLLDNQQWEEGAAIASARDWSGAADSWGVRWFALTVPRPASA